MQTTPPNFAAVIFLRYHFPDVGNMVFKNIFGSKRPLIGLQGCFEKYFILLFVFVKLNLYFWSIIKQQANINHKPMKKIKELYDAAKSAKTGETCKCPGCNTPFVKASYQQAFCKTHKGTVCKDKYWNTVTPSKRNNTTRISSANALYYTCFIEPKIEAAKIRRAQDKEDLEEIQLNNDGSWDAHQASVSRCKWCERLLCQCRDHDWSTEWE